MSAWWPRRKKKRAGHVSDLGLRPLMDELQNLRRRSRKTQRQTRTVVIVRKDITSSVNIIISIVMLSAGFGLGIWYRGNGGGGDNAQTIQKKMVPVIQEVIKPAVLETPPKKESRIISPRPDTTASVANKSPDPEKPPESMSPAKRLLLQLQGKSLKE